jgi:hypothetical protein
MLKPTPFKRILEVRYERGYRYLDHCGEAMLILQEVLPSETDRVWMPEDITPAGAKLKCPDLDLRIAFDTTRYIVEQTSGEETPLFSSVAATSFAVISGRFDLRSVVRVGSRRFLTVGTDSTEEAEALSLKLSPVVDWPSDRPEHLLPKSSEAAVSYETEDGAEGFNLSVKPISKIDAQEQVDERARLPARLLEKGQKEALIEQMRRKAKREKDPSAGVLIDLDYYFVRPAKLDLQEFWKKAVTNGDKMVGAFLARS